jgi:hypothetical protein
MYLKRAFSSDSNAAICIYCSAADASVSVLSAGGLTMASALSLCALALVAAAPQQ